MVWDSAAQWISANTHQSTGSVTIKIQARVKHSALVLPTCRLGFLIIWLLGVFQVVLLSLECFNFLTLINSLFSCLLCFRGAYLAARRPCRQRLPGTGLPAARSDSEATSNGACPGGISEEGVASGQGSGGLGGWLSGCLLGNWRPVFHSDVPLSQRTAVCQDHLELLVSRSQIRTRCGQKQRPDQVARKIWSEREWKH